MCRTQNPRCMFLLIVRVLEIRWDIYWYLAQWEICWYAKTLPKATWPNDNDPLHLYCYGTPTHASYSHCTVTRRLSDAYLWRRWLTFERLKKGGQSPGATFNETVRDSLLFSTLIILRWGLSKHCSSTRSLHSVLLSLAVDCKPLLDILIRKGVGVWLNGLLGPVDHLRIAACSCRCVSVRLERKKFARWWQVLAIWYDQYWVRAN